MDLKEFLHAIPLAAIAVTANTHELIAVNPSFCKLADSTEDDLLRSSINDLCNCDPALLSRVNRNKDHDLLTCSLNFDHLKDKKYNMLITFQDEALVIQFIPVWETAESGNPYDYYRLMFENAPMAYQSLDENGNILDINPKWLQILGYDSREEVIGKWFGDFLADDFVPHFKKNFPVFKKNGCISDVRFKMESKAGEIVYISFEGAIGYNPDGSFRQTYCIFKDITSVIQMESNLKESEERYRSLFKESGSVMLIIDPENGRIIDANQKACSFYGYSLEKLISMFIHDINILDKKEINGKMSEVLDENSKLLHFKHKLADGTVKDVEVFSGSIYVMGKTHLYSIVHDITEKVRIQKDLQILTQAVDQSPSSIVITDRSGYIEYVNPRFTKVTGYTSDEAIGKTPSILKSGFTSSKEYSALWKTINSGGIWHGIFQNVKKNGELFWEDATIGPIVDENGTITHFVGVKKDISRQKQMEEQLSQMQKMESIAHLAGGIAHDFNNLLTIIQGNAELIDVVLQDNKNIHGHIQAINEASDRAAALTQQMLLFSRNEDMDLKTLDLKNYLPGIRQLIEFDVPDNIRFRTRIDKNLYPIKGDISNIEQAILNLCINAVEAMPEGGELNLLMDNVVIDENDCQLIMDSKPGDYVLIQIEDSGKGISAEHIDKIFDPFYSLKDEPQGHGMGLAVVYGIVKKHQGWINVYSEVGHGSVFKIYLPALAPKTEERDKTGIRKIKSGNGEKILLIEDEDGIRNFCRISLEKYGYKVDEANSGELAELLFKANNGNYDLILSDVILPDTNGFDLVQKLTADHPRIKVVMNSGYSEERSRHRDITEKGIPFIQKPFKLKDLVELIQEVL